MTLKLSNWRAELFDELGDAEPWPSYADIVDAYCAGFTLRQYAARWLEQIGTQPAPDAPSVATPDAWDFETTFPVPTPEAYCCFVVDTHYPDPDDEEAVYLFFEESGQIYCGHLADAEAHDATARHLRQHGRYPGKKRPPDNPTEAAETHAAEAQAERHCAAAIIEELQRIYGSRAADAFRAHCDEQRQTDADIAASEADDCDADEPFALATDRAAAYIRQQIAPPSAQRSLF